MLTNFFDVIFLLIFAFCTLWGFFIGFLGSLVLFGFIFLGAIFAKAVHLNLQSLILNLVGNPNLSAIVSFVIILGIFILTAKLLRILLQVFFSNLAIMSRVFGGLIGFVIGIILSYAFFYTTSNYVPVFADEIAKSRLANFVLNIGQLF